VIWTRNAEIDVIWDKFQPTLETLRKQLNAALGRSGFNPTLHSDSRAEARPTSTLEWQEWEIPREADAKWPDAAKQAHTDWWQQRIARQKEMDASIAATPASSARTTPTRR
jgi:adenine-specific DNA-methyltransferase